jgi:hypothetical protein
MALAREVISPDFSSTLGYISYDGVAACGPEEVCRSSINSVTNQGFSRAGRQASG